MPNPLPGVASRLVISAEQRVWRAQCQGACIRAVVPAQTYIPSSPCCPNRVGSQREPGNASFRAENPWGTRTPLGMGHVKYSPQNKTRRGIPQRCRAWGNDGRGLRGRAALCPDNGLFLSDAGALFPGLDGVGAWLPDDFPPSGSNPAVPRCSSLSAVFTERTLWDAQGVTHPQQCPDCVKVETFLSLPWLCRWAGLRCTDLLTRLFVFLVCLARNLVREGS